jgi:hypothetical protein
MAQSLYRGYSGPLVPLGLVAVGTPGTPVQFTVNIDPTSLNAPETFTPAPSANNTGAATSSNEFTITCQQIIIQAYKSNGGTGVVNNTGNIYIMMKGAGGSGNRTDFGAMVAVLTPGQTLILASAPVNCNVFNPYKYFVDADNPGDSALVTLVNQ